jgi:hypothetical protein
VGDVHEQRLLISARDPATHGKPAVNRLLSGCVQRARFLLRPALTQNPEPTAVSVHVVNIEADNLSAPQAEVEHQPDDCDVARRLSRRLLRRGCQERPRPIEARPARVAVGLRLETLNLWHPCCRANRASKAQG